MRLLSLFSLVMIACGGATQSEYCKKYLACTEAVTPGSSNSLLSAYGPTGSCWQNDSKTADLCATNCSSALDAVATGAGRDKPECK